MSGQEVLADGFALVRGPVRRLLGNDLVLGVGLVERSAEALGVEFYNRVGRVAHHDANLGRVILRQNAGGHFARSVASAVIVRRHQRRQPRIRIGQLSLRGVADLKRYRDNGNFRGIQLVDEGFSYDGVERKKAYGVDLLGD